MNKKGFTFFSDAINTILIIFILIVFFAIMYFIDVTNFSKSEDTIGDMSITLKNYENSYIVLNLLRTKIDSINETFADMIYIWYGNNSFYERFMEVVILF